MGSMVGAGVQFPPTPRALAPQKIAYRIKKWRIYLLLSLESLETLSFSLPSITFCYSNHWRVANVESSVHTAAMCSLQVVASRPHLTDFLLSTSVVGFVYFSTFLSLFLICFPHQFSLKVKTYDLQCPLAPNHHMHTSLLAWPPRSSDWCG
ncbi:hypothetical protein I3760_14G135000 [Carya illinoinensis]|nr:hypothetical protein I3760_14G135000 [Carya illinoinensis]